MLLKLSPRLQFVRQNRLNNNNGIEIIPGKLTDILLGTALIGCVVQSHSVNLSLLHPYRSSCSPRLTFKQPTKVAIPRTFGTEQHTRPLGNHCLLYTTQALPAITLIQRSHSPSSRPFRSTTIRPINLSQSVSSLARHSPQSSVNSAT